MPVKKKESSVIEIQEIKMGRAKFNILGTTPMLMHRFDQKAWHELLLPKPKTNRASREQSLKHDPIAEFRGALYLNRNPNEPAFFHIPSGSFSATIADAAVDLPGASKSEIKRLTTITSMQINCFGVPRLKMDMVRSSDMARTPDVRTRPIFEEWACTIEVEYVASLIRENNVANLLNAAGVIRGIGDWRPQKGGGYGKFKIVEDGDRDFQRILRTQARAAQQEAFATPVCYDADTEELFAWFNAELLNREMLAPSEKVKAAPKAPKDIVAKGKRKGKNGGATATTR